MGTFKLKYNHETDEYLIDKVLTGNAESFSEIVRRYKDAVFGTAMSCLRNYHEAEDVAQEVFLDGYIHLASLKEKNRIGAWLCTNARHKSLNRIIRNKALNIAIDYEALQDIPDNSISLEDIAANNELHKNIYSILSSFSNKLRETVFLYYISGYTQLEISNILKVPIGTIKRRLFDARKVFERELKNNMSEEDIREIISINKPGEEFIEKIKEKIKTAQKALNCRMYGNATDYCNDILDLLSKVPTDEKTSKLKINTLSIKGMSVRFTEGYEKSLGYHKDALKIAEELNDNILIGEQMMKLAHTINPREKRIEYYLKASEYFDKANNLDKKGDCSLWTGSYYFNDIHDYHKALSYFNDAFNLIEPTNINKACCYSAINLTNLALKYNEFPIKAFWRASASKLKKENEIITMEAQPGFIHEDGKETGKKYFELDIFFRLANLNTIVNKKWNAGFELSGDSFSYTINPLKTKLCIKSINETVTTSAGTFSNCLEVNIYTELSEKDKLNINEKLVKANLWKCGLTKVWFAPGVGIVKKQTKTATDIEATVELTSYLITEKSNDYLPLSLGNKWSYKETTCDNQFEQVCNYEVFSQNNNEYNLSTYAFACFKGTEEEYKQSYTEGLIELGNKCFSKNDLNQSLIYFKKALDKEKKSESMITACKAAIKFINQRLAIGDKFRFISNGAGCTVLRRFNNEVLYVQGKDGGTGAVGKSIGKRNTENKLFGRGVFRASGMLSTIVNNNWSMDTKNAGKTFTFMPNLTTVEQLVESTSETVTVLSGTFHNCMKIKINTKVDGIDIDEKDWRYRSCGLREFWFAPGVGIVKAVFYFLDDLVAVMELDSYKVNDAKNEYLPLNLGNMWSYKEVTLEKEYKQSCIYEVTSVKDDTYYLSVYNNCDFMGSEEDYLKFREDSLRK